MMASRWTLGVFAAAILLVSASAADPAGPVPATVMLQPGKLLISDDLAAPMSKEWKVAKGKWEVIEGAIHSSELPADKHGAVARRSLPMKDAIIAYSFKIDGAKKTTLSLNAAKGHLCRVLLDTRGVAVQKDDQDGKKGPDKPMPLDTAKADIRPGQWHTLVVELHGPDILATVDGKHTAFGSHPAIDKEKANFGLTVAGESASFKNLRVWEAAGTSKNWEATRAKLLEARKK
jgi:hypothetical protein